ncbi:helix-turn-helix domain-containing protein [Alicyclobacillus sendaiensis]|uniref:Helix-turn-helix transcriptional regulator n=1 Tax=Alicyclobacillus sendaiensis PA2 TaxID=3029425 RepID=A0ABT6Y1S7_ALISE|nr:helix-turn-helix transcriptional regulator [Alicyclobacillus sendaiensis]MDI9261275.1 helix-turn-helix transcriptional regulator [Alicyclobacillus sendaiensis PA2]
MYLVSKLPERLIELRTQRNLKQRDLAEFLGIALRSWQRYEAGEREPTVDQLMELARFFGVSLDYMVGLTDDPTPPPRTSSSERDP